MPLVRFQLRNEYGLGGQELYKAENDDDPKALLEGVAVAGLVGILRQLGDLAEFAAEVFHGLQEQLVTTAARSHKMIVRVQGIEAALPLLEKTVLAQTSHIHFAYTAGCEWHPKIRTKHKHLAHSDLPRFIMDSYEECRDPPCLHLLDKFDNGGPGACLKRYSDPSFFRRAMNSSGPLNAEKEQRQKKVLKGKKKHLGRRSGLSRPVSISQCDVSFPFTCPKSNTQSSAGETISAIHMRSNSGLEDPPTSFDSRSRSADIECVFDASSSMQYEDQEHNQLQTSILEMRQDGKVDPISLDAQERATIDDLAQGSLQQSNSSSVTWDEKTEIVKPDNNHTDETVENGEFADLVVVNVDLDKLEVKDTMHINVDPEGVIFAGENSPDPFSEGNLFDEAGSETDRFMDALNTLESEAETDSVCQTKREVERPLANFKKGLECGSGAVHKTTFVNSELSHVESEDESNCLSNKQMSPNFSNLVSSECLVYAPPPEVTEAFNPEISVGTDFSASTNILDVSRVDGNESAFKNIPSSSSSSPNSQAREPDNDVTSSCQSEESVQEISDGTSVKVWTNGGLLGLEPSKPPDYGAANIGSFKSVPQAKDTDGCGLSSNIVMPESHLNGSRQKLEASVKKREQIEKNLESKGGRDDIISHNNLYLNQLLTRRGSMVKAIDNIKCSSLYHDKQDNDVPEKNALELASAVSEFELENSDDSCRSTILADSHEHNLREPSLMRTQEYQPVIPEVISQCKEACGEDIQSSLSMNLRQFFFVNGFQTNNSVVHGDTSESLGYVKTGLPKLKESNSDHMGKRKVMRHILPGNEQLQNGSPGSSLSSSPPLEHMKIFFHPMDGFETSKLKLQFPGEHHFHESIKDVMFPSFQLLPEPAAPLQDIDSGSENDTFCRSSSYTSEELMSQHSVSSSEQWESGGVSTSKDNEIYNALFRVSSADSISSAFELDGLNHVNILRDSNFRNSDTTNGRPFHSDPLFDLPSFDTLNSTSEQKRICSNPKDNQDLVLQYPSEQKPVPPPLPPVGWRMTKPPFDVAENVQVATYKAANYLKDEQVREATTSQQSNAAPQKQPSVQEVTPCLLKNKDHQKLDRSREADHAADVKETDDMDLLQAIRTKDQLKLDEGREAGPAANDKDTDKREDLLHQIRTKSFNLRRTVPARPTLTPDATTNTKVAAIIQKANAIRQAYVGSDEGGDNESWSDG